MEFPCPSNFLRNCVKQIGTKLAAKKRTQPNLLFGPCQQVSPSFICFPSVVQSNKQRPVQRTLLPALEDKFYVPLLSPLSHCADTSPQATNLFAHPSNTVFSFRWNGLPPHNWKSSVLLCGQGQPTKLGLKKHHVHPKDDSGAITHLNSSRHAAGIFLLGLFLTEGCSFISFDCQLFSQIKEHRMHVWKSGFVSTANFVSNCSEFVNLCWHQVWIDWDSLEVLTSDSASDLCFFSFPVILLPTENSEHHHQIIAHGHLLDQIPAYQFSRLQSVPLKSGTSEKEGVTTSENSFTILTFHCNQFVTFQWPI